MSELIDITAYPIAPLLNVLLKDKTTGKNIIWATDTFLSYGEGFQDKQQITKSTLISHPDVIQPRVEKSAEDQLARTRKKAEVFTRCDTIDFMNNYADEDWFGRPNVFNTLNKDHTWTVTEEKIEFPEGKTWQEYVDSRRLEITCGEAPFLVSRYDTTTGELIEPPKRRIGILDRKLRIVNENTDTYEDWIKWATRAIESVYGYEYQGDNLLIARINVLLTFCDYYKERWNKEPDLEPLRSIAIKITWNIWQMDGLKDTVPLGKPQEAFHQMNLFEMFAPAEEQEDIAPLCKIQDWRSKKVLIYHSLKEN